MIHLKRWVAKLLGLVAWMFIPVSPVFLFLLFWKKTFLLDYAHTVKKMRIHVDAISNGPLEHYFADVFLRKKNIPVQIEGTCVQCGNCCLEKKCMFLEPLPENKFQCGIYSSVWRRFSNCNSYPLHADDIARYNCPSFTVAPIRLHMPAVMRESLDGNQLPNPLG